MTRKVKVVGFDPSLNNWGIAHGHASINGALIEVERLDIIQPKAPDGKQVRNNSKDLDRAGQLFKGALAAAEGASAVFVEVPHGSQSARAMASYGICIGVLAALRAKGVPIFELTEREVKLATHLNTKATKQDCIDWAGRTYPNLVWPTETKKGVTSVIFSKAEHMADAVATLHAGVNSVQFQQLLSMLRGAALAA